MLFWEFYLALAGAVIVAWLFGIGYRRLGDEAQWTAAKAELQSTTARAKALELAAKGAIAELDEMRGKLETVELENARLGAEAGRIPELERITSELREELSGTQEARAAAESREATATGAAKAAAAELESLRRRLESSTVETARLRTEEERLPVLESIISELRGELARTQQGQAAADARATAVEGAFRAAEAELSRVRAQLEALEVENGRLRSEAERLPLVEGALSELRDELARTQEARLAGERRAEQADELLVSLEFARSEVAALAKEKAQLESRAALVAELQETATRQEGQLGQLRATLAQGEVENARLRARIEALAASAEERQAVLEAARTSFGEAFRALSAEALDSSRQTFLNMLGTAIDELQRGVSGELNAREKAIDDRLGPVHETVTRLQVAVQDLELSRLANRAALSDDLQALRSAQEALRLATSQLAQSARGPASGPRPEATPLRSLVEMSGLSDRCSFEGQAGGTIDEGQQRPDAVIHLPEGRTIAIDSRVPLDAYLASLQAEEETLRQELRRSHAVQMRRHVERLAAWARGSPSARDGQVIMYVPMEDALAAALEEDPGLIHHAVRSSVIPGGPVALLTLLKTAAWTALAADSHRQRDT